MRTPEGHVSNLIRDPSEEQALNDKTAGTLIVLNINVISHHNKKLMTKL